MKKVLLVLFSIVSISVAAQETGIHFEKTTWAQIVKKAKAEKKLIFMDAYTSWCGPCKQMSANVFPDAKLGTYFNANFINAKIDMEEGEGPALAAQYPVRGYPTLMFIDPVTGKVVNSVLGSRSAADLLEVGQKTAATKKKKA
jgi:thioredoxin 1